MGICINTLLTYDNDRMLIVKAYLSTSELKCMNTELYSLNEGGAFNLSIGGCFRVSVGLWRCGLYG